MQVARSNHTLPVGGVDHDFFENQYYMEEDDEISWTKMVLLTIMTMFKYT